MKKINSLLMAMVVFAIAINAKPVALNTAQTVAQNFFSLTTGHRVNSIVPAYTESDSNGTAVYYVFNINPGQSMEEGFVIVSADDIIHPVIGYGNENRTYVNPKNEGNAATIFYWMQKQKNEIIQARRDTIYRAPTDTAIASEWKSYLNNVLPQNAHQAHQATTSTFPSSSQFLCQTVWAQDDSSGPATEPPIYYNSLCPDYSLTGCVATATAQIMQYWQYPSKGTGSSSYCDCTADGYWENYGTLSANYGATTYHWNNMPLNPVKVTDIDTLMYDIGVSVDMNYAQTGSASAVLTAEDPSASAQNSLTEYFGYSKTILHGITEFSNQTVWQDTIEKELDKNRPLMYEGTDASYGGHAWVCDGYDASNYFHMNWGWFGACDGYYTLTDLDPGAYNFTSDQAALIGIVPPPSNTGAGIDTYNHSESVNLYPNPTGGKVTAELSLGNTTEVNVEVYNMLGQMVQKEHWGNVADNAAYTIDLSGQPDGIYLVKLITNTTIINEKIIVAK